MKIHRRYPLSLRGAPPQAGRRSNLKTRLFRHFVARNDCSFSVFPSLILVLGFLISATGCDAFVRKFTRKKKAENIAPVEMVLAPEEYKPPAISREDAYRQYFLFWKSWQDELFDSLVGGGNQKKQLSCLNEAVKNLNELRNLLNAKQKKGLDLYLAKLKDLGEQMKEDIYGNNIPRYRSSVDNLRRGIMRDFSYRKVEF